VKRGTFGTRFGFYMAAVGAAFGLGTLWRFPYVTGVNGGGAFVLLYIFFVGAIGLPILISELMLGKLSRRNIIGALTNPAWINPEKRNYWRWFGRLAMVAAFIVLSYYAVISGWVIHFIVQGIFGHFTDRLSTPESIIDQLLSHGYLQILLASVHIIITTSIVARGVREGIEKSSRIFMPILFVIMLFLVIHSLFLPGASEAIRFLFYPNFSKLSGTAVIDALGHALFTLSLGFGAMVAYGSYLKDEVHIPSEAVLVAGIDVFLSLCSGVLIFPIVFTAHVDSGTGPALLFKTMPVLFGQLFLGYYVALAFFICLYFAALSASIALFEGLVAYLIDQKGFKRTTSSYIVALITFMLALASALSGSVFKNIKVGERGLLETIDQVIINWTIPVVAFGVALFVSLKISYGEKKLAFVDQKSLVSVRLFKTWLRAIKYAVPALIIMAFVIQGLIAIF
jgi:NSS family neurotransmitter:Na+ symporter